MARFYAFERAIGKVEYSCANNCVTGERSVKGQLFVFSSLHHRALFIKACPSDKFRHIVKHSEVRGLFLGMSVKGLEALLLALPIDKDVL